MCKNLAYKALDKFFFKRSRRVPKKRHHLIKDLHSLGHPEKSYPTIHIAGTNGKGSVATKIAKALEYAGYRVGLFTSPHIENFEERIQIDGVQISREDVEQLLPPLMQTFPDYCFFDYTTFLAFQYFEESKVDVAVFETGIGGRHDTTNVITPLVSVITSISFDHVDLLGPTLDDIAYQKAGIIKPGVPVVIGPKARFSPIFDEAQALQSKLVEVPAQIGDYDQENQAIARAALQELNRFFEISPAALEQGVLQKPPCRFERHGRFVMDVAHNVEGFKGLLKAWQIHHAERPFVAVVGFSLDKDAETCLRMMAQKAEHLFLVSVDSTRAASLEKLQEIVWRAKIPHFTACATVESAIQQASSYDKDVLVCGSFYIMKQARTTILEEVGKSAFCSPEKIGSNP